jgi:hypothetical protein
MCPPRKRELIRDTPVLNSQTLFVRPVKIGKQLTIGVAIEDVKTKKNITTTALVDSGCMRTCIDETFARNSGLVLTRILKPIKVEYADRTSVEDSTIWYSADIRIRAAGATVITGALVTRLKSAKLFLGFDWLQSVNPKIDWRTLRVEAEEGTDSLKMRSTETSSARKEAKCRNKAEEGPEPPERQSLDATLDHPGTQEVVSGETVSRGTCSGNQSANLRVEAEEGKDSLKTWSTEAGHGETEATYRNEAEERPGSPERRSLDKTPDYPTIYKKVFLEDAFNGLLLRPV